MSIRAPAVPTSPSRSSLVARAFGVLGDPVGHSRSPAMHGAAFEALGLPHRYFAFHVTPAALPAALAGARALGLGGLNLTVPHKRAAVPSMDELTPAAARIGAVNAVCIEDGRLRGDNTDGVGFLAGLRELGDAVPRRAVVLGSGGAARAVVDALVHEAGAQVRWVSRRPATLPTGPWTSVGYPELAAWLPWADLLVQATTVGMHGGPTAFPVAVEVQRLPAEARVVDLVYPAPAVGLLADAADRGLPTQDGRPMLLWQGVRALEQWLAMSLSPEVVQAMRDAIT
ncbi:shikimate dehydrogenase family protein [Paraliomyxa miuraensis]|uniref:shikimate dehydrogenase family protein n=1 Tax=Paraliomyxa miuraensis TaxID=376150 RepID=UPI002253E10C|nr:shikimate dehydrogenase [Paraliomyxa miuraensis]MCX4242128.1 shikimate dehydrogenase [Paraliomyxa miuraensis]